MLAGSFVVWRGPTAPSEAVYWDWCLQSPSLMIKDLLDSSPIPHPATRVAISTSLIGSWRLGNSSFLYRIKSSLCPIVPQHNLPLPAPGPHPHPLPDPIMSPGHCLKCEPPSVIYGPGDAKVRTQIVRRRPRNTCVVLDIPAWRDSSQDMGLDLQQATQSDRGYLSPDKQNSHCFLLVLWPRSGSREAAAVVRTP